MSQPRILITGAAAGIGFAAARRFAREGWEVGLMDLNEAALAEAAAAVGDHCTGTWVVDVTDEQAVAEAVGEFARQGDGRLDVLLNSAGILRIGPFAELSPGAHHQTFAINVNGTINVCHAAYPWLRDTAGARVINMSSASALYGVPQLASYSASKFAVRGLTEALNIEWAGDDIQVCDIMPPFVRTTMLTSQQVQPPIIERMGVNLVAEDVAEAIWQSLTSEEVHLPVSRSFRALVNVSKWVPGRATRAIMQWLSRPA